MHALTSEHMKMLLSVIINIELNTLLHHAGFEDLGRDHPHSGGSCDRFHHLNSNDEASIKDGARGPRADENK